MTFRHTGTPIIVHSRTFKKSFCISSSATTKLWNIVSRSFDNKKFDFCIPFHPLIHLQFSNRRDNTHTQLTGEIKQSFRDRGGCDRMVIGFTITYVISAYHHWCCEFESRSGRGPGFVNYKKGCTRLAAASDKVCQLHAHGRWPSGSLRVLRLLPPLQLVAMI